MSDGGDRTPLVIAGAGPAGDALALLLASRSIATTLIERHDHFAREFPRGVILPSGLRVLDALGVDVEKKAFRTAIRKRLRFSSIASASCTSCFYISIL